MKIRSPFTRPGQVHFYRQLNAMDCGPSCLRMIARHYGKFFNAKGIRDKAGYNREGVSLLGLSTAATALGFHAAGTKLTLDELKTQAILPCILHWDQNHFVVLVSFGESNIINKGKIRIADPARGVLSYTTNEFMAGWTGNANAAAGVRGTCLLLEPTRGFYGQVNEPPENGGWNLIRPYLQKSRWLLTKVLITLAVTTLLQLIFPFLTQSIVDVGIQSRDISFVTLILAGQVMLLFSQTMVEFIRSRLLLHVSTRINLSILSDFWIKLTRLPVSYFDRHHTGDTLQRIGDNKQIQNFLTGSALMTLFSVLNFLIYSVVLAFYNVKLFVVFAIGSTLYFLWIRIFLRIRRKINYQSFAVSSSENAATLQLVQGMQEIRLNNAETTKRWEWEDIQARLFKLNFTSLSYSQVQQAGALLINQGKDVVITFIVAGLVINGQLTFGAMLAIQYIIGQLTNPIEQFVGFIQNAQDARISMERLNEIHQMEDEVDKNKTYAAPAHRDGTISFDNLTFAYPGVGNDAVLRNLCFRIREGETTAVVGASGSGKTSLLKLLLRFYDSYTGHITVGEADFREINPEEWRKRCGAVLQEGYIFNDSIAGNIAVGAEHVDAERIRYCCELTNISSFVDSLPNGLDTLLGADGVGISQGQKQRLLIARSVYRNPRYLFFDEATNALDAINEKIIVNNLKEIFTGRTVVVVAHRLSTVKNADNILVLNEGMIAEQGTHEELVAKKGKYYELIKNQLELGN